MVTDSSAPLARRDVVAVEVGDETVLIDRWNSATVVDRFGRWIWDCLDGESTLRELIDDAAETLGETHQTTRLSVHQFIRMTGQVGLLEGVGPPDDVDPPVRLEPLQLPVRGDAVNDVVAGCLDGVRRSLSQWRGVDVLAVNWSPHCGYCASIAERMAAVQPHLDTAGIQLVLISTADAAANRPLLERAGLRAPMLLVPAGVVGPFFGFGTPAAFHLGPDMTLEAAPVEGSTEVLSLAGRLADVDPEALPGMASDEVPAGTRYLLATGGACAPATGSEPRTVWSGTRAYRINEFHVGIGHDSDATAQTLDALFLGHTVDDRRAGHSFSVALPMTAANTHSTTGVRDLNLLVRWGRVMVRSRSAERVLRALLWHLSSEMGAIDVTSGRLRVSATAATVGGQAVLLQPGLHAMAERLQPLLAFEGITLADIPFPEIDLETTELVIPEPEIPHSAEVLAAVNAPITSRSELPPVRPGRYPLAAWGVMHQADQPVTGLSRAQAAAATLSFVQSTDDPPARLTQLGDLFDRIEGFGLWYYSEAEYASALTAVLASIIGQSSVRREFDPLSTTSTTP